MKFSLILVALLAVANPAVAADSKKEIERQQIQRLKLVWPSWNDMRTKDRSLLLGISSTCKLEAVEKQVDPVLQCLREGAQQPNVIVPRGFLKEVAPEKLEFLIKFAK